MKTYTVKDVMVPLADYATVADKATLLEAVMALEKAQKDFNHERYRHRALLVLDDSRRVVGKISQLDVLRALEPKYDEMWRRESLAHTGLTREFMKSMLAHYDLWSKSLDAICKAASGKKVKDFMYTPSEDEYIEENGSLGEAVHLLVLGHHQSLLVTRNNDIVGILRLTDVFAMVVQAIKECEV